MWGVKCQVWSVECGVLSVTTGRSPDIAIRKKYATRHMESAAPATQNDIGGLKSVAPATKHATLFFWKRGKSIAPATQNDF